MSERREQVLAAALALWQERGEGFTMDELVARSEVPRAALYRIFPKKAEVLKALAQERGVQELVDEPLDITARILEAARVEFLKSGVLATFEQIAERAGVGVATLYRRYKDKPGLLRAAVEEQPLRKSIKAMRLDPDKDIVEQLTALVEGMLVSLREYGPSMLVILRDAQSHPEILKLVVERQDRTYQILASYLSALMERGLLTKKSPEESAVALISLCFFAAYLGPVMGMSEYKGPAHHAAFIVSLFLDGARAHDC